MLNPYSWGLPPRHPQHSFVLKKTKAMIKQFFLMLATVTSLQGIAQTNAQAFDWAFNTGGAGDNVKKMAYNSAGDLFVLGQARDTAAFGNVVIGAPKVGAYAGTVQYLGKRSASGSYSVLFNTYYQSNGSSITPVDFCLDNSNNIYMIGTVSTLPPNTASFGNGFSVDSNCFFVAKLNASGTTQWVKKLRLGTNFTSFIDPLNVTIFPNGDILFVAQSSNSGSAGAQPVRFVRLTPSGTEVWQREYFFKNTAGGPLSYYADKTSINGFLMDNNGNFYLKYRTINDRKIVINTDTVVAGGNTSGAFTFFCAFNSNGLKKYYKGYNASIGDVAVERSTGNVLMSYVQQTANPAPFNTLPVTSTLTPAFSGLVITDSLFNFIKSSQSTVSTSSLYISPVSIYPLGGNKALSTIKYCKNDLLAAGSQTYTNSAGTVFAWKETDANCVPVYFIAEPSIAGNCNTPNGAIAVNGSKAAVCGVWPAATTITINTTTLTANDKNATPTSTIVSSDAFITQFDRSLQGGTNPGTVTAVPATGQLAETILYPNPGKDQFTVLLPTTVSNAMMHIADITGKQMRNIELPENQTQVAPGLDPGIYLVQITWQGGHSVSKIIIE